MHSFFDQDLQTLHGCLTTFQGCRETSCDVVRHPCAFGGAPRISGVSDCIEEPMRNSASGPAPRRIASRPLRQVLGKQRLAGQGCKPEALARGSETPDTHTAAIPGSSFCRLGQGRRCIPFPLRKGSRADTQTRPQRLSLHAWGAGSTRLSFLRSGLADCSGLPVWGGKP